MQHNIYITEKTTSKQYMSCQSHWLFKSELDITRVYLHYTAFDSRIRLTPGSIFFGELIH